MCARPVPHAAPHPASLHGLPTARPQAAEAGFEAAYAFISQAQEAMSEEEKAKPIKQMKPTVRRWHEFSPLFGPAPGLLWPPAP